MLFLLHSALMLSVVKLLLKGEVGVIRVCALNSHGNYIVDHGKIMELLFFFVLFFSNFCGNPAIVQESIAQTQKIPSGGSQLSR